MMEVGMVSMDGAIPSQIVGVSASVNLPLHHKVQNSLPAPAHPGGLGKTAVQHLCALSPQVPLPNNCRTETKPAN